MASNAITTAYQQTKWALLLRGLLGIALGAFIFMRPLESVAAAALIIAVWALVDGIVTIVHAFQLRSIISFWGMTLVAGIVGVLFGVAALYYYPVLSLTFAVAWTAWWLITGGAFAIYISMQERKADLPWGGTLTSGIIALGAGILAFMYPAVTLVALMSILAGFGIVRGIAMLIAAGKMQSLEHDVRHSMGTPSRA